MQSCELSIFLQGDPFVCTNGSSLLDLTVLLPLPGNRFAIERNGEIVPHSQFASTILGAGDRIEIIHAVGGG